MERLCAYCGSRSGRDEVYREATVAFGREIARRDVDLVYGGGGVGLMNVLAQTVLSAGGEVIGVIPESLTAVEEPPENLTDLRTVGSMHARKRTMYELAQGFVALPGGLGTLDELFEMLTWAQLGIHEFPCGILNVDGYYDGLLDYLDHAVAEGFVPEVHRELLLVEADPVALVDALAAHEAPSLDGAADVDVRDV